MERKTYNASIISRDADGRIISTTIGYVEDDTIFAAAGYWTHTNWTAAYDADWRNSRFSNVASVEIVMDDGATYKNRLGDLSLPPAYSAA